MNAVDQVERELRDSDIEWAPRPLPDPPPMSRDAMIVEALVDALSYRRVLCESLDRLHDLALKLDRALVDNRELRERLRREEPS